MSNKYSDYRVPGTPDQNVYPYVAMTEEQLRDNPKATIGTVLVAGVVTEYAKIGQDYWLIENAEGPFLHLDMIVEVKLFRLGEESIFVQN
jgi:hypothetical protein